MKDEEIENLFLSLSNPKITQKIEYLRIDEKKKKKVKVLRKKWASLIKEFNSCFKKFENFESMKSIKFVNGKLKKNLFSSKEKFVGKGLGEKINKIVLNPDFNKDIINLTKESKLYPLEHWSFTIMRYVLTKSFLSPIYSAKMGLEKYFPVKEIFTIPKDLNFAIKMEENKKTKEPELFVQIFEHTILRKLKKNWRLIMKCQKRLRKTKEIKKGYYPDKLLEIEKKLAKLDLKKMSDWEKQEDVYGEIDSLDFGPIENKRKNRLKKVRQRLKKKLKP